MDLIIVESPTKARTLTRFLGKGYLIEATMGHIMDLPKSKLGVDVKNNFKPDYLPIEKRIGEVEKIKKEGGKAEKIYLATDPDREGEAISAHIEEMLLNSKKEAKSDKRILRITFHEITKEAVEEGIAHPRKIDKNLVDAQIARRVLDRLVGYNLSPLLWRKVRRGLSAGRVQSVCVRLIVEREREIEKFKSEEYWEIFCEVKPQNGSSANKNFIVQLIKVGEKSVEIKDKKTAEGIVGALEKADYKVSEVSKREVVKNPYPPFTTSTMTQAGARLFFWSAKKTMLIAQKLYEEGLITYHRTDSTNIATSALEKARAYIKGAYGDKYLPENPRIYKTQSKVAQEAHEAIRPTSIERVDNELENDAKRLYELIWKRFLASQMTSSVYDETTIDVEAANYLLRASGQTMKFDGWRKVIPAKIDSDVVVLPEVEKGESLELIKVDPQQKFTEPPARFNEASLIKTLEKLGIGRPSTYAPIISTIQIRQYVEKNEGKFVPTSIGFAVNDFLLLNFPDVFEYAFTAQMEDALDDVANGKKKWVGEIKAFWDPFSKKLETVGKEAKRVKIPVEKLGKTCPKCKKGELVIRIGRFGKFVSCSRFPDCDYSEKYIEKLGMICPLCNKGEVIIKTTRKGRKFYGCSRYPDCKFASWKNPKINQNHEG